MLEFHKKKDKKKEIKKTEHNIDLLKELIGLLGGGKNGESNNDLPENETPKEKTFD